MLIKHKKGGVRLPKYNLLFPKEEAVEIKDPKLAEKILRNSDFEEVKSSKNKEKGGKER